MNCELTGRLATALARLLLLITLIFPLDGNASSKKLSCVGVSEENYWIKALHVNPADKTVALTTEGGPLSWNAILVNASEMSFDKPVYAFNLPPLDSSTPVTNVFKLFYVGSHWRLISAGLLEVDGTFTLRAIEKAATFECSETA